ncbi:MAG: copper amine oxidase N-terminal domain-containing protein [Anaerotignum sp.]|nr:copper amine oxidase N-terminal domain-containing protein [Anaerotignum sp.]
MVLYYYIAKKETADADKKEDVTVPPAAEETPADPEGSAVNEYQITIGKADITKNGEVSYTADVAPYLKNGYTMLPLRALLEVSNPEQKVNWNNGTKSAHTFVNNRLVSIKPGEATYTKALETIDLYTPAETVNGRLFVSLRDWMSIMEIDVSQLKWDATTKTVTLKY